MKKEKVDNDFILCDNLPDIKTEDYPHYFIEDMEVISHYTAVFNCNNYYVIGEFNFIKNLCWLSIICIGDKKENILAPSLRLLNKVIKNYKIGFCWEKGYKSEILIKRLSKNFKVKKHGETEKSKYIILIKK